MSANKNGTRMSRAERHEWVCMLKEQGHTFKEIAALMGVAVATVTSAYYDPTGEIDRARKAKYDGVCADCGGRTGYASGGQPSERCRACAEAAAKTIAARRVQATRKTGSVKWTDEQVHDAIRAIAVDGKATTTAYKHAATNGRKGEIPSLPTIVFRFGSWRNAVHAAGLTTSNDRQAEVYANRTTDEGLLCALEDCAAELGCWPSANEFRAWSAGGRSVGVLIFRQRFGTWMNAIEQAMARNDGQVPA